jgi:membrane protease YdiL (CAAX protease family)
VSTADGLIAAMLFFVLQAAFSILLLSLRMAPAEAILLAFAAAGIMVYAIMRLVYLLTRASNVPAMLHGPLRAALLWGAGGGLMVAAIGYAYLLTIRQLGLFDGQTAMPDFDPRLMFALAVVAAPLCEEFIFRGLIFGGLRRSMGVLPSMLSSAALFAIIHPPVSIVPVFVLGLCTAWVYDRTRALLAPVLVHAVYNAFVIGMA